MNFNLKICSISRPQGDDSPGMIFLAHRILPIQQATSGYSRTDFTSFKSRSKSCQFPTEWLVER